MGKVELTLEIFDALKDRVFELLLRDSDPLRLELIESAMLPDRAKPDERRAPFSLLFQGAADLHLPQQIHRLRHPELGVLEVFLVPMRPNDKGALYEAIFN